MKVILLKDVQKVGHRFEVKEVSDGFANNFLLPRGLAEVATSHAVSELQKRIQTDEGEKKVRDELLYKGLNALKGSPIKILRSANEEGHLFAGVHEDDIKKAIEKELMITLPEGLIHLKQPIKTIGEHSLDIHIGEKRGNIKIIVEAG